MSKGPFPLSRIDELLDAMDGECLQCMTSWVIKSVLRPAEGAMLLTGHESPC